METRGPRIRIGALALRLALIVLVIRELFVFGVLFRKLRGPRRLWVFLFHHNATPKSLKLAFLTAILVTFVAEILSALVVRPLVRYWLTPKVDHSLGLFRLAASEWMLEQSPARRLRPGMSSETGTIVRTNQRVWFIPEAWDAETWAARPEELTTGLEPSPPRVFGLIEGFPDQISSISKEGERMTFAVSDPETVMQWFRPGAYKSRKQAVSDTTQFLPR